MKIFKKSAALSAAIAASMAVVTLAPEAALAHGKKSAARPRAASAAPSVSSSTERRLQAMEDEIASLRAELSRAKSAAPAKVEEIETKQQQLEQQVAETKAHEETHHNDDMVYFRGGYAKMEHGRGYGSQAPETLLINKTNGDNDGWYAGAGFDFRLTNDAFGLTDWVSVDGELMVEYKNFGTGSNLLVAAANLADAPAGAVVGTIENKITQLTVAASPKIKFNNLGIFRPWIIPFGLGIHVISPPSSGVTVLNPGLMMGTGVDINIWNNLWAGVDFRYHFTGDDLDFKSKNGLVTLKGVDTDGLTTGAYIGFGF